MSSTVVHKNKNIFLCHLSNFVKFPPKPCIVLFCIHACVTLVTIERLQSSITWVSKTSWVSCMSNVPHWQDVLTIGIIRHNNRYSICVSEGQFSNISSIFLERKIRYFRAQPAEQTRFVYVLDIPERTHRTHFLNLIHVLFFAVRNCRTTTPIQSYRIRIPSRLINF